MRTKTPLTLQDLLLFAGSDDDKEAAKFLFHYVEKILLELKDKSRDDLIAKHEAGRLINEYLSIYRRDRKPIRIGRKYLAVTTGLSINEIIRLGNYGWKSCKAVDEDLLWKRTWSRIHQKEKRDFIDIP